MNTIEYTCSFKDTDCLVWF